MVAGYCWKWVSKNNSNFKDIVINNYSAKWNLIEHSQIFLIHPDSVTEVGCIHTCQGLELDYVGVIIGPDLIVRNGRVITDGTKRASTDRSLRGIAKDLRAGKPSALKIADQIIKNTYRTLLTRGMKGFFIFSTDSETQDYFRNHLNNNINKSFKYNVDENGASLI